MLDIANLKIEHLDTILMPLEDDHLSTLKQSWYRDPQQSINHDDFVDKASAWFRSTTVNSLQGWDKFPCVDVIMGCTHFIESLASKHKWNIQILGKEYAYYTVMGKNTQSPDNYNPAYLLWCLCQTTCTATDQTGKRF